ncbi:MAG: SRPBCC domain-containing protein [Flavobacteriaceae bacterium]|nr:SRPBCC domain-containing protein [Flavobacteriaceae bacterium]
MNFTGEHVFKQSRQQLWNHLMDPKVLAKITPGKSSELEALGNDRYKTVTHIKLGPVNGAFQGKLNLIDKNEPESFSIQMEQLSKIGNAQADMQLTLKEISENQTKLSFVAEAKLSGVIARTGQRVMSAVANKITKDIFESIEEHIEEEQ